MHGGRTPKGISSPNLLTGRYSTDLPARLGERFEKAVADSKLVQLGHEIALIDARMGDLLSDLSTDSSGAIFNMLRKAWDEYENENEGDHTIKALRLMHIKALIDEGAEEWMKWREVYSVVEQRRKLVDTEARRQVQLNQTLTVSQVMTLVAAITDLVKKYVRDKDALRAISSGLAGLVSPEPVAKA